VLYGKDTGNLFTNNTVKSNKGYGIWVVYDDTTNNPTYAATYGINSNTGNTINQNTFTSNTLTDAFDQSLGSGTAGTANTWRNNTIGTKNPSGLK
jgi:hypothetical protein